MRVRVLRKAIKDPDIDLDPFPSEDSFSFARYHPPQVEFGDEGFYRTNPQISVHLPQMDNYNFQTLMEPWDKSLSRVLAHEVGHQLTLDEEGFGNLRDRGDAYGGAGVPQWTRGGYNRYTGWKKNKSGQAEKDLQAAIGNAISSTNTLETPSYHMEYPESSYLANKLRIERQVMPQIMPSVRGSMRPWGGMLDDGKREALVRESMPKGVANQRRAYELVDRFGGRDATPAERERAFRRIKGVMARQGSNIVNRPLKDIQQAIRREEAHDSKLRTARKRGFDIPSLLSGKTSRGAGHLGRRSGYKMTGEPMDIAFQLLKAARNPEHKLAGGDYAPKNLKGYIDSEQAAKDLLGVHDMRISDHFVDKAVERGLLHPSKHRVKGHTQFDNSVIDHGKHFNPKGGWGGYGNPLDYFRDLAHVFVAQHGIMPHETVNLHMADRGNDVYVDRTHGGHRNTWGHSMVIAPDDMNPGHHALTTVLDETAQGKRKADAYSLFDENGPHSGSMFNSPRRPSPHFRPQAPQAPQRQLNLHDITPEAKGYLNEHFQNPDNHHHGKPMFSFVKPRGQTGLEARWSGGKPPAGWNNTVGNHQQTIKDAIDGLHTQAELGMTTGAINDLHSSMNETMSQEYKDIGANYHDMNQGVEGFDPSMFLRGTPMDMAFQLLKERKSPEAFAHKLEYDKKYQKTPKRVKYREQLNTERRRRGIYGKGGKDVSHTQGGKLTLESPHSNRARHFKNRGTLRRVKVVKSEYKTCKACGKPGVISEYQPRCVYCHKRF